MKYIDALNCSQGRPIRRKAWAENWYMASDHHNIFRHPGFVYPHPEFAGPGVHERVGFVTHQDQESADWEELRASQRKREHEKHI